MLNLNNLLKDDYFVNAFDENQFKSFSDSIDKKVLKYIGNIFEAVLK